MSATSALLHQFDTAEQQKDASTLGMWVFLVTEIMFFGGMFTAYIVYRTLHPEGFVEASHELNLIMGAINTAVLDLQQPDDGAGGVTRRRPGRARGIGRISCRDHPAR